MRILFITDLHIKISTFAQLDNLKNYLENWFSSEDKAGNILDCIVIGGDTLDTHEKLCSLALNKTCDFFSFLLQYAPLYILVGNHDYINNSQFCTTKHWLNVLKKWQNVTVIDRPIKVWIKDMCIALVPYVPVGMFKKALEMINLTQIHLIFAHQEFRGCDMGSIKSSHGDKWLSEIQVISGHIHNSQTVGNVYYPGSSLAHSYLYPSIGPCVISKDGIEHIGFESQIKAKTFSTKPNISDLEPDVKYILTGTNASIAEIIGNPILKKMLAMRKLKPKDSKYQEAWEHYLFENIPNKAMRDDLLNILAQY